MSNDMFIYDEVSTEFVDILKIVLILSCERTHIPEIYEIFGKDNFLKFMDIFSGSTLEVPKRERLSQCIKDTTIFIALHRMKDDEKRAEMITDLALKYECKPIEIRKIFYDLKEKMGRYDLEEIYNG